MTRPTSRGGSFAAGFAGGLVAGQLLTRERVQFARLAGSSIVTPPAAGWVTDFLNAAYYRRSPGERQVDDLRLASSIITTFWLHRGGRRLRASDVVPFHKGFGRHRFLDSGRSARGTLSREQLLEGADRLLGSWFSDAYSDDARRGWASRSRASRIEPPTSPSRACALPDSGRSRPASPRGRLRPGTPILRLKSHRPML